MQAFSYWLDRSDSSLSYLLWQTLQQHARDGHHQQVTVKVRAAGNSTSCLDTQLRKFLAPINYNEQSPPQAQTTAEDIFAIPELLEMVLSELDTHDLLRVMQASRQLHRAVTDSVELQRKMFLLPHANNHLQLIDLNWQQERPTVRRLTRQAIDVYPLYGGLSEGGKPHQVIVSIVETPAVGATWRRMLVASPIIKTMKVTVQCCGASEGRRATHCKDPESVTNEQGLTVGDLHTVSEMLIEKHKRCPIASVLAHDSNGDVEVLVTFTVDVALLPDDPKLLAHKKLRMESQAACEQRTAHRRRMHCYKQAKESAWHAGQPIPTLQEFEGECSGGF